MSVVPYSHFSGEVQAVQQVPHEEDSALRHEHASVKADGHYEGDEQHVHQLPTLERYLG